MTTADSPLLWQRDGHVLTLTLNRPDQRNALNLPLCRALLDAARTIERDRDAWVVILTGAGSAFCAGADLHERRALDRVGTREVRTTLVEAFAAIERLPRPTIAAVNGYALGGGFELALACDFILASEAARFALPETTLGIIPGGGGTQTLPRLIGPQRAKELIFTGRRIDAAEAVALGVALRQVPAEELLPAARELADRIAQSAPVAVRQAKRAIDLGAAMDPATARIFEDEVYNQTLLTDDRDEGLRAFAERRRPVYRGE